MEKSKLNTGNIPDIITEMSNDTVLRDLPFHYPVLVRHLFNNNRYEQISSASVHDISLGDYIDIVDNRNLVKPSDIPKDIRFKISHANIFYANNLMDFQEFSYNEDDSIALLIHEMEIPIPSFPKTIGELKQVYYDCIRKYHRYVMDVLYLAVIEKVNINVNYKDRSSQLIMDKNNEIYGMPTYSHYTNTIGNVSYSVHYILRNDTNTIDRRIFSLNIHGLGFFTLAFKSFYNWHNIPSLKVVSRFINNLGAYSLGNMIETLKSILVISFDTYDIELAGDADDLDDDLPF